MSHNIAPAAPKPTDPAVLQADVDNAPAPKGSAVQSKFDEGSEEKSHDPLASAAIMHVHPTKEGLNVLTPAGGDGDPKFEMMKEAAGQDTEKKEHEGVGAKVKEAMSKATHAVEEAVPGTKEYKEHHQK